MWWIITIIVIIYLVWRKLIRTEINPADVVFTSSFIRGSDPTALETIIIDEKYVTWKKNRGWNYLWLSTNYVTMMRSKITGVVIVDKVIGTDIIIMGEGGGNVRATCFKPKDVLEIKQLLTL